MALRQNRDGLDDALLAEAVGKARDDDVASRNRDGRRRQRNDVGIGAGIEMG